MWPPLWSPTRGCAPSWRQTAQACCTTANRAAAPAPSQQVRRVHQSYLPLWHGPLDGCVVAWPAATVLCHTGATTPLAAAAIEYRRDPSGGLLPMAVQRLAPGCPELLRRSGPLQQLIGQADAAWRAPGHPGWEQLKLGGNCFEVGTAGGGRGELALDGQSLAFTCRCAPVEAAARWPGAAAGVHTAHTWQPPAHAPALLACGAVF